MIRIAAHFLILSLLTLITSCGGPDKTDTKNEIPQISDTTSIGPDSLEVISDPDSLAEPLLARIPKGVMSPFDLDSSYIADYCTSEESQRLSWKDVEILTHQMLDNETTVYSKWDIQTFKMIDSTKSVGKYDEYVSGIDIGQTESSDAFILETVDINENTSVLLWYIDYATYPACPYAEGTNVYGTLIYNGSFTETALLGELSSGGDAPYWGSTKLTSTIHEVIELEKVDASGGDEDEEGNEIIESNTENYSLKIVEGKFEKN